MLANISYEGKRTFNTRAQKLEKHVRLNTQVFRHFTILHTDCMYTCIIHVPNRVFAEIKCFQMVDVFKSIFFYSV